MPTWSSSTSSATTEKLQRGWIRADVDGDIYKGWSTVPGKYKAFRRPQGRFRFFTFTW